MIRQITSTFTPGPWELDTRPILRGPFITKTYDPPREKEGMKSRLSQHTLAEVIDSPFFFPGEAESNARLMWAAPDLYFACMDALMATSVEEGRHRVCQNCDFEIGHSPWCWVPRMVAAIRKAEGRS